MGLMQFYDYQSAQSVIIFRGRLRKGEKIPDTSTHVIGYVRRRGKKGRAASNASGGGEDDGFRIENYKAQVIELPVKRLCRHKKIPGLDADYCPKCSSENYPGGLYYLDPENAKNSLILRERQKTIASGTPSVPTVVELSEDENLKEIDSATKAYQATLFDISIY